ncbi:membrane dipeptidase [Niveispirillum sp.]|uniref:dipeptidase n=1 Tax=Niveispirillum sp. TaxID=1917217 RepID=UPI001B64D70E|nr:membrane dipeptidase [Niveispirillum sp.]MBP7340273.1 membrane dipeptidase [Niveispirillum sp.]
MSEIARRHLLLAGTATALLPAAARAANPAPIPGPAGAVGIRDMLVVNVLGGLENPNLPPPTKDTPRAQRNRVDERALADARRAGLNAVNVTIGWVAGDGDPFEFSVRDVAENLARIRSQPDDLHLVLTAADIERSRAGNRIGMILGFQNGAMFGTDPSRVDLFADMGVRVMQLTYNIRNELGSGSVMPDDQGLTPLGREVLARIEANRVQVDLSHSNRQTCLDAIAAATRPLSINHTGCRALTDLPRNKTDAELRGVADKGGFIGIYFMPFLAKGRIATANDVADHILHAVKVAGEDHIGIGTDGYVTSYDDMDAYMEELRKENAERVRLGIAAPGETATTTPFIMDLRGPGQFQKLADLLLARGLKSAQVEKILGRNYLRFARDTWG